MQLLELGSTGLRVSEMGLGLAAIGRPGYINLGRDRDLGKDRSVESMRQQAHALLDAAYDGGVRYVDAARSYGRAEEFLASWLDSRAAAAGPVTVGSKWGYRYTAGWQVGAAVNEIKDHSRESLRRQIRESRGLLGERLSLYQIHSATLESGVLDDPAVLAELALLRDAGLAIGLTVSGLHQADTIRRALNVRIAGKRLFGSVQATWNLFEPSAGSALSEAHDAGLGIIVKEALANGRLVERTGEREVSALPRPVREIAGRHAVTPDAVALAAALAQPWRHVVLSGAVTPAQIASNISAAAVSLTPDDLVALTTLAEPPERYWRQRAELAWR